MQVGLQDSAPSIGSRDNDAGYSPQQARDQELVNDMSSTYYCLKDDMSTADRWFLKGPRDATGAEVDPRRLLDARPLELDGPLYIPLRRRGWPLDFTLADFDMPVLRSSYSRELQALAPESIPLFHAVIEGSSDFLGIVNVLSVADSLDEQRSDVDY